MRLFLLRHAQAANTTPDADRILTEKGGEQIRKLCRSLNGDFFEDIVQIWHSPYARAVQTAELFKNELKLKAPLVEANNLKPEDNPNELARTVAALSTFGGDLMIVSHNPFLEYLASLMLGNGRNCRIYFRKASLVILSLEAEPSPTFEYGEWSIDFLARPSLLAQ